MDWFGICCLAMLILGIIICIIAYRRAISKMLDEIGKEAAALETRHTELEHSYQILRANVHNEERDALRKEELDSIRQGAQKEYEDYRKAQYDAISREVEAKRNEANMALRRELDKAEEEVQMEQLRLVRLRDVSNEEMNAIRSELNILQAQRNDVIIALKAEEEIKNNQKFHSFSLSVDDKEDIAILKELVHRMRKSAPIYKLIWSEYYQRIYGEMADRILGKEKITGIYKITHIPTKKCYIGQAVDVRIRWANHIKTALHVDGGAAHARFHDALEELGLENFTWELLEKCPKEKLNEREKFYIEFYQSNDWGWNSNKGVGKAAS